MPLISTRGLYGLKAIYELSKYKGDTPIQIKEISSKANIPQNYLEQLLSKLRKAEFIKSIRGAKGGYILAKSSKDILVKDILITLEDDLKIIDGAAGDPVLNMFFNESKDEMKKIFDITLAELDDYQDRYNQFLHYSI